MNRVVIAAYGRSAIGRANKGSLRNVHPVDFGAEVLQGVLARVPALDPHDITDVVVGCAKPEGVQGFNMGKLICLRAGLPFDVAAQTVNRFCASGLQAIATAAAMIELGQAGVVVAGGVEKMTGVPMGAREDIRSGWLSENAPAAYMPMGITAENVAARCHISRRELDQFALESHQKAAAAQEAGKFAEEIIPVHGLDGDGNSFIFDRDEGIRPQTTLEKLAALKPAFREDGVVTAGNASQMSDGAGFVVMMSEQKAAALGIVPIAKFLDYAVAGVDPSYMGLGPIRAVPRVMQQSGLSVSQMDVIELNEAFAAQALPCMRELSLPAGRVNPNGGAIALGHPLGATGAFLTCKLLSELRRREGRYGLVTMCVGGGMGAAGIYEMVSP